MDRICVALIAGLLTAQVSLAQVPPGETGAVDGDGTASRQGVVQVGEEVRLTFRSPAVELGADAVGPTAKPAELTRVWQQELYMPGASYVAPHFGYFNLPRGAHLVVRAPDHSRTWSYTGFGKADHLIKEGFWGIHVAGDKAVVELYSRVSVPADAVVIDGFAHGYPDLDADPFSTELDLIGGEQEAICGSDNTRPAKCYQTSQPTIYDKSRAVARLLINGTGGCTGWLIGNQGHLMTNNHCITNASDAANTDYEFMAEGANCSAACSSFGSCPGTVVATSATLVQTHVNLDFSLVQLPTNVSGTYGFLQLRDTGAVSEERIYLPGHPGGKGKRIGVESNHASNPSGFCEVDSLSASPCIGGSVTEVGYYCDTEDGSSGSPVLAYSDHCVVALHHCGTCLNRGVKIQNVISTLGSNLPANAICGPPPPTDVTLTFTSTAAQDGWIRESTETSNVGGTSNSTDTTATALLVGDDASDRQYKSIVSFNTAAIPDGATVNYALLSLYSGTQQGLSPFFTHGACFVDIRTGGFGGNNALAVGDFQAAPTVSQVMSMSDILLNPISVGFLYVNQAGVAAINKTGVTQFRVYFALDDDDNLANNYIGFFSGDHSDPNKRPVLQVNYTP